MLPLTCPLCCECHFDTWSDLHSHLASLINDGMTCPKCNVRLGMDEILSHVKSHADDEMMPGDMLGIMEEVEVGDETSATDMSSAVEDEAANSDDESGGEDEYCCAKCGKFLMGTDGLTQHEAACISGDMDCDVDDLETSAGLANSNDKLGTSVNDANIAFCTIIHDPSVKCNELGTADSQETTAFSVFPTSAGPPPETSDKFTVEDPEKTVLLVMPSESGESKLEPQKFQILYKEADAPQNHQTPSSSNFDNNKEVFIYITNPDQVVDIISCRKCRCTFSVSEWRRHHSTCGKIKTQVRKVQVSPKTHLLDKLWCESCGKNWPKEEWGKHVALLVMCEVCDKYVNHALVDRHVEWLHKDMTSFQCDVCEESFERASLRLQHMSEAHPEVKCLYSTREKAPPIKNPVQAVNQLRFLCPYCWEVFSTSELLRKHVRTHLAHVPTTCVYCPRRFTSPVECWEHERIHCNSGKPYLCHFCTSVFETNEACTHHMNAHADSPSEPRYEEAVLSDGVCQACGMVVDPRDWPAHAQILVKCDVCLKHVQHIVLDRHVSIRHSSVCLLRCPLCDDAFTKPSEKLQHMLTHTQDIQASVQNETCLTCPVCQKVFVRSQWFKMHLSQHEAPQQYACSQCARRFRTEQALLRHEAKHPEYSRYMCPHCPRTYLSSVDLKLHYFCHLCRTEAPEDLSNQPSFPGEEMQEPVSSDLMEEMYVCEACDQQVPLEHYVRHRKLLVLCEVCYQAVSHVDLDSHMSAHNIVTYPCTMCQEEFPTASARLKHLRANHSELGVAIQQGPNGYLICPVCKEAHSGRSKMSIHLRRHTGERPYMCRKCDGAYYTRGDLWRHMQQSHSGRNHTCMECHKSFPTSDQMRSHMSTHAPDRRFLCRTCGKRFKTHGSRNAHEQTHSNEKLHVCETCGKACKTRSHLWNHKQHHEKRYQCNICGKRVFSNQALMSHAKKHIPTGREKSK